MSLHKPQKIAFIWWKQLILPIAMTVSHYLFLAFECSSLLGLQLNAYQESGRKTLPKDIYMPALWLISSPVLARNFAMRQAHFVFFCLASKNAILLQFKRLIRKHHISEINIGIQPLKWTFKYMFNYYILKIWFGLYLSMTFNCWRRQLRKHLPSLALAMVTEVFPTWWIASQGTTPTKKWPVLSYNITIVNNAGFFKIRFKNECWWKIIL